MNILTEFSFMQGLSKIKGITPAETKELPNNRLLDYHRKTHMFYAAAMKRYPPNKTVVNEVVSLHNRFVREMEKRGMKHNTPLEKLTETSMYRRHRKKRKRHLKKRKKERLEMQK
jgi:hypothetical protein